MSTLKLKLSFVFRLAASFLLAILLPTSLLVYAADGSTMTVHIYDSGRKLSLKTAAWSVGELLDKLKIEIHSGDRVEPNLTTPLSDHFHINIYRARPTVIIEGKQKTYFMTASLYPKTIGFDANIPLYDGDQLNLVTNQDFLEAGLTLTYQLQRSGGQTITETEEIPFPKQTRKDYTMAPGQTKQLQTGELGRKTKIFLTKTQNGHIISRSLVSEKLEKSPVPEITLIGTHPIEMHPLTKVKGRNRYTIDGIERQETFYDLNMKNVMQNCGAGGKYSVRPDGVKIDSDGYVIVAAELSRYPRCSIVKTSLGLGKVYDTGSFALTNPEQFDLATDWTRPDGI